MFAEYGWVLPDQTIALYERTLSTLTVGKRSKWPNKVPSGPMATPGNPDVPPRTPRLGFRTESAGKPATEPKCFGHLWTKRRRREGHSRRRAVNRQVVGDS